MNIQLLIENNGVLYEPVLKDEITWETERNGTPGKLSFTVIKDDVINFTEGNAVRLTIDKKPIFYGFVFSKKRSNSTEISVVAYDQLRYLKNKDTYIYTNMKASQLIEQIAKDFNLQIGEIDDTEYIIPARSEDNVALFDMIQNALDETLKNKNKLYVMYDDFGKITLKNIENMRQNILIEAGICEGFSYTSSIDSNVYNQIKLCQENEETGKRKVYIVKDTSNINKWGVLQYFENLQGDTVNAEAKADALLSLYNQKTRNLSITNALGDLNIRAGVSVIVKLELGDINVQHYMICEKVKHYFKENEHYMDLTFRANGFRV